MPKKTVKKTTKKVKLYKIELEILHKVWKSEGKTIEIALSKLPLTWNEIKGKGMIKVSYGKDSFEKLMVMPKLRGIVINKISRQIWAKHFMLLLK